MDPEQLEHFLATAGSSGHKRSPVEGRLAASIFERELGRPPDGAFDAPDLDTDADLIDLVAEIRSSTEWWATQAPIHGAHTVSYRTLAAQLSAMGHAVAPQAIAEGIATYRLLLIRDPDISGLQSFVDARDRHGLPAAVRSIAGSAEARSHLSADEQPSIGDVLLAVSSTAISILSAVAADTALGVAIETRTSLRQLGTKVDAIAAALAELTELVHLRFDGEAGQA